VVSKAAAIPTLATDWKSSAVHLEPMASENLAKSSQCKGLLKTLKDYSFLLAVYLLLTFLAVFKKLFLIFKSNDLMLNHVTVHTETALHSLQMLEHTVG
jgi:hypothetical protein